LGKGKKEEEFDLIASILFAVMAVKLYVESVRIFDFNLGLRRPAFGVYIAKILACIVRCKLALRQEMRSVSRMLDDRSARQTQGDPAEGPAAHTDWYFAVGLWTGAAAATYALEAYQHDRRVGST
jgi:hypothetical protein